MKRFAESAIQNLGSRGRRVQALIGCVDQRDRLAVRHAIICLYELHILLVNVLCICRSIGSVQSPISLGPISPYGTGPVNIFIKETFSGALKLEEHQVSHYTVRLECIKLWSSL